MSPSADQLPACPECQRMEPSLTPTDEIRSIGIDELREWEGEIERIGVEGVRHAVDASALEGEYDSEEWWWCSYFDHRHRQGFLVWSRCGRLLSIGSTCGRKYLANFDRFEREVGIARKIVTERRLAAESHERAARLRDLAAHVSRVLAGRSALEAHAPEIHREMFRALTRSELWVDVRRRFTDPETQTERVIDDRRKLAGLEDLFGNGVTEPAAQELLRDAMEFSQWVTSIKIGVDNHEQVAARRIALSDREAVQRQAIERAERFWTEENLHLAAIKTFGKSLDTRYDLAGSKIIVKGPPPVVVGVYGVEGG